MGALYRRGVDLPQITSARGVWLEDAAGRRYLDAASGALVVNIGHGDEAVIEAAAEQARRVAYAHPTAFTVDVVERYADRLAARLPMGAASVFPVSGGSEAVETALKMARAYHLAKGHSDRTMFIGRRISFHGSTRAALDVGDRSSLREPYLPWLGLAGRVPGVLEYRCPNPDHPDRCAAWHAGRLEEEIETLGADTVAAFIAEPIGGAASGAAMPPDGYWEAIADICRAHDVLIITDEVMTGFGRTGAWFGSEHFELRPDIMTMAKGASSGYWPLGVCAVSGAVREVIDSGPGLVHGFTYSHHPVGAAVGDAVLDRIEEMQLVESARARGEQLLEGLRTTLATHPLVGDVRGIGLLVAIEIVADRDAKTPFPRSDRMAERIAGVALDLGLVVYPSSGVADGVDGDLLMVGPPLIVDTEEVETIIDLIEKTMETLT